MAAANTPSEAAKDSATFIAAADIDATFKSDSIDLISAPLSSRIVASSNEWFAEASNLLTPTPPIRQPGKFVFSGAWYDGWETRRHNPEPFDWVVIRLGVASGRVKGVEIDTAFFDGNHAPEIEVQGCHIDDAREQEVLGNGGEGWRTILEKRECGPSQRHGWLLPQGTKQQPITHVRLCMFPDGGIARFRLFGNAIPLLPQNVETVFDLAATVNGGVAVACSDQHFGTKDNLLLPGRGVDMGDGWETKRSRGDHADWVIVRLGVPGVIEKVVVDTAHFRGNFPQKVRVFAMEGREVVPPGDDEGWTEILEAQRLGPDKEHEFGREVLKAVEVDGEGRVDGEGKVFGFVKMVIIPDGGVKRLRVFGRRAGGEGVGGRMGRA